MSWRLLTPFWLGLLVGGYALTQVALAGWHQAVRPMDEYPTMPPRQLSQIVAGGHKDTMADLLYLNFLTYFGRHIRDARTHGLMPLLQTITDLDPDFKWAYELGALALGDSGRLEEAVALLDKGARLHPLDAWYPYQTGLTIFFYSEAYLRAARYFDAASKLPNAPPEAPYFAARMYANSGQKELAIAIWRHALKTTNDPTTKKLAEKTIKRLEALP